MQAMACHNESSGKSWSVVSGNLTLPMPSEIELRHDGVGVIINFDGAVDIKDFIDIQNHFLASPRRAQEVEVRDR